MGNPQDVKFWKFKPKAWRDVFDRLAKLNEKNRVAAGQQFEIFAKHFFVTNPRFNSEYSNVWSSKEVPLNVRRKLNLPRKEHGYDLILKTYEGNYAVVQCKFTQKQSEKKIHWTGTNLSSWLAVGSKADILVIFTNASTVDSTTRMKAQEKKFREFNLVSLLELTEQDLGAILSSIRGRRVRLKRFFPKPHQKKAIEAVVKGLKKHRRGKLILPCGAGKTLTALWVRERMKAPRTLVLVPSLALLRQFKNDWKTQESIALPYLCVCSEKDIDSGIDSTESHVSEIAGPVTTDAKEIRSFLKKHSASIVYSTYQSSPKIVEGLKNSGIEFDLVVCDEAHKTSGSKSASGFSSILDNKKIPAKKRLFMTATPKIVGDIVKNRLGDKDIKLLADMNDEGLYGPELFRMSFADAIDRGILVNYKIVAIGVRDSKLQRAIKARRFASDAPLDEITNNFALEKVMHKYSATHAITFHSSVKRAQSFQERHEKLVKNARAFHVNGTQPTSEREEILKDEFKNSKKAVVTNARCLTEGVDLPAVDFVYFCDPRYSRIDIVQAAGRALRLDPKKPKKIGYIVVPIFHQDALKLERAIEEGAYKNLVAVVRAMADQDARIEEEINLISYGEGERGKSTQSVKIGLQPERLIAIEGFERRIQKSIFDQVITRSILPWRPFAAARKFVHSLKLESQTEWVLYCKGKIPRLEKKPKPDDIPASPRKTYKDKGWIGMGDWLGTG